MSDKRVIACNYLEAVSVASKGALCYVVGTAGDAENIELLIRSRSGRWIQKWERLKRIGNFRFKTLPPEHPRYKDERIATYFAEERLAWLKEIAGDASSEMPGEMDDE